jgi:valyl-tRNA synthetase
MKLDPRKRIPGEIFVADEVHRNAIERNRDAIERLATLSELTVSAKPLPQGLGAVRSAMDYDLRIPYAAEGIDVAAEQARILKEIEGLQKAVASKEAQLANDMFRSKAPEKIIQQMEEALATQRVELHKLMERLKQLGVK